MTTKQEIARSVFAVLLGLAVIVPLINYYRVHPASTLYSEVAAGILFLGAVASSAPMLQASQRVHASVAVFVLGIVGVITYQVLTGRFEYKIAWLTWIAYLLVFFVATCLGTWAANDPSFRRLLVDRLTFALSLAALFNAFAQFAQASGWAESIQPFVMVPGGAHQDSYKCTPAGNVAQLNHANVLAWLGICSLLYLVATNRGRVALGALGIAVLLFSSALTSARMAWPMMLAIVALIIALRQSLNWSMRRAMAIAALIAFGFVLTTLAKKLIVGDTCLTSIERLFGASQQLDYWVRIELMRQALMVWASQPLLGVGAGKFLAAAFALESDHSVEHLLDFYPHNAPLEILASFGIVGGGLLVFCGLHWISRMWQRRASCSENWPMIAGGVVLVIHSLLEMPLWYLYFLIPFALMLGVSIGPVAAGDRSIRVPARFIVILAAAVGLPAFVFALVDHSRAERALWLSSVARETSGVSGAAVDALAGITAELRIFKIAGEREMLRFAELKPSNLVGLNVANRRLMDNMPDPLAVSRQIMIEAGMGNTEKARDLFRRLMAYFPKYYESFAQEMRKKALEDFEHFGSLVEIIDEEMARPPRQRRVTKGLDG